MHTFFGIYLGFIFLESSYEFALSIIFILFMLNVVIKVMDVCLDTFKIYLYFSLCVFFFGRFFCCVFSVFEFSLTFLVFYPCVLFFFYCCRNTISARGFVIIIFLWVLILGTLGVILIVFNVSYFNCFPLFTKQKKMIYVL